MATHSSGQWSLVGYRPWGLRVGHGWANSTFPSWKLNMKKEVIQVENECMIWKGISLKTISRLDFPLYFKQYMLIQSGYPVPWLSRPQLSDGQPKGKEGLSPRGALCTLPSVPGLKPPDSSLELKPQQRKQASLALTHDFTITTYDNNTFHSLSTFELIYFNTWGHLMASTVSSSECDGLFRGHWCSAVKEEWVRSRRHAVKIQPVPPARPGWVFPTYRIVFQVIFFFFSQIVFNEMFLD